MGPMPLDGEALPPGVPPMALSSGWDGLRTIIRPSAVVPQSRSRIEAKHTPLSPEEDGRDAELCAFKLLWAATQFARA